MNLASYASDFADGCCTPSAFAFGRACALLLGGTLVLAAPGGLEAQSREATAQYDHESAAPVAQAVRIHDPITVDGVLDEAVWMTAPPITEFIQEIPDEGQPVSQPTEVRFLYDDESIYVGAWLWDDGEILTRLARRDTGVPDADFFVVLFDSYHDHRTAYRFATSPSAMKRDEIVTGGGFGDTSWDPVWEVETTITDEGWFVEMRIPFSQLRFRSDEVQLWGLQVERKIRRHGEDTVWAYTPRDQQGGVARFGHLEGLEGIDGGRGLEILPYLSGRAEYLEIPGSESVGFDNPFRSGSDYFGDVGLDIKYSLGSNLTLDATVNPDFGQVEMDPAVINLTAFETRFSEQRPFFVEGAEIFRFGEGGGRTGQDDAQLLYSRRIGRSPQGSVPGSAAYSDVPSATTILGAVKLTGKTTNDWSVGLLNTVTGREAAPWVDADGARQQIEVEPLSNYFAARARRDVRQNQGSFGAIFTSVHRDLRTEALDQRLRSQAYAVGADGRVEWNNRSWVLAGKLSQSLVRGSPEALAITQRSPARYMHRPDASHLDFDPTATSLSGTFGKLNLEKQAGTWQGGLGLSAISPGYEVNDLGFQNWADRVQVGGRFAYVQPRTGSYFRRLSVRAGSDFTYNFDGQSVGRELSLSTNGQLLSFHGFNARFTREFSSWDDRLTRGGPLARVPSGYSGNVGFNSDSRGWWQVRSSVRFAEDEAGGWQRGGNLDVFFRFAEIYEIRVGPDVTRRVTAAQYLTAVDDASADHTFGRRYVFGELEQTTVGLETRFNVTFTPGMTLELYAQPFLSTGRYSGIKELAAPRTFDFRKYGEDVGEIEKEEDGRYRVDPHGDGSQVFQVNNPDFNLRSLIGNAVFRWEWRPGSTLFLVWQQTRSERLVPAIRGAAEHDIGEFNLERESRALFGLKPDNVLMFKVTYWLNP